MSFKLCVIGCGAIAWRGHGPAYRQYAQAHPEIELAACVDADLGKANQFAAAFGFKRVYSDLEAALDAERPDAVSLFVPAPHIAELAVRILRKGYPLLMEKPPGVSREEALRIAEAAQRPDGSSIPNRVAFNRRYMPLVQQARAELAAWSDAGKLHHISYDMARVGRTDSEDISVTAIHGIDALRFLAGSDYKEIRMDYRPLAHLGPRVTNVYLEGEFESGVTFRLNCFPVSGAVLERATFYGEGAALVLQLPFWTSRDSPGSAVLLVGNEEKARWDGGETAGSLDMHITNGFYAENASFLDDLRANRKPTGDIRSAIQSVEVAACILDRVKMYQL